MHKAYTWIQEDKLTQSKQSIKNWTFSHPEIKTSRKFVLLVEFQLDGSQKVPYRNYPDTK